MFKLNRKDREKARELSIKETQAKRRRDLAKSELEYMMANYELWTYLSEKIGYDLHSDDTIWEFNFKKGEIVSFEENKPLYTDQQINGWKWRPLS